MAVLPPNPASSLLPIHLLHYRFPGNYCPESQEISLPNSQKLPSSGRKLIHPMNSDMPEFRYVPGDSVSVTFAEATEDLDFDYLTGNQARNSDEFYTLAPDLPEPKTDSESGLKIIPVLAIQVTHFPGTGICIGIINHHAIGDASSIVGFIKAWSRAAKLGENQQLSAENQSLPFYDRSATKDPSGRANIFWNQLRLFPLASTHSKLPTNRVRATFILRKNDIQILKNLALAGEPVRMESCSGYVGTVWRCGGSTHPFAAELRIKGGDLTVTTGDESGYWENGFGVRVNRLVRYGRVRPDDRCHRRRIHAKSRRGFRGFAQEENGCICSYLR
ncbi:Malonyl-coenzyme:anthocyanin 5-O-glucoside-6'''-O-malonyltransferase [Sesamum angolense]|uniref:Malonyl-coenzyme:anthocyanin 5-O-glucoside-6'''-O-malonyltransferase n=1 Tax=Sesamum angolense TaxID=2727404 RepID=A0AAE1XH11_9LAMI|nr:Malonyl-coenzyme:anthocyanin 5-O-glucoside-6'''-O-malonyltransferase [Sesamum angolense]